MKHINNISKKLLLVTLLFTLSFSAGTYEDRYSVDSTKRLEANNNTFMQGQFEEIIRFDMINFKGDSIESDSEKTLNEAIELIQSYLDNSQDVKVTIIGHTQEVTDEDNEVTIDSDTYANHIQNWFRDSFDTNESNRISLNYAQSVQDIMKDNNISEDILVVENRRGDDVGFSDATEKGKNLSNRVMVTLYVMMALDIDSDKDGIFDKKDKCPGTPRGSKVDSNGCPLDSDGDGVLDYKDRCKETPLGVDVDKKGCPLDSDGDGIADYKDKCLLTPAGVEVDPNGCALKRTLAINFRRGSDKILTNSNEKIQEFAEFMKNNKAYNVKIIGHTDSNGKESANMDLSQRRAIATKNALVLEGVTESRISTAGRGELDPIESNRTKEGRHANRRIEVVLSL